MCGPSGAYGESPGGPGIRFYVPCAQPSGFAMGAERSIIHKFSSSLLWEVGVIGIWILFHVHVLREAACRPNYHNDILEESNRELPTFPQCTKQLRGCLVLSARELCGCGESLLCWTLQDNGHRAYLMALQARSALYGWGCCLAKLPLLEGWVPSITCSGERRFQYQHRYFKRMNACRWVLLVYHTGNLVRSSCRDPLYPRRSMATQNQYLRG